MQKSIPLTGSPGSTPGLGVIFKMDSRTIYCKKCGKECIITEYEDELAEALRDEDIEVQQQKCDGFKHIDLVILSHKLNIEVDGDYHRTTRSQRRLDYLRDKHSERKGFETIRITNGDIEEDIDDCVDFIEEIMEKVEDQDDEDEFNIF